MVSSAADS